MFTDRSDENLNKLTADLYKKIGEAFSGGVSVIELTNLFGYSKIEFVHGILRNAKLIPLMSRTGKRHLYDIDPRLQQGLKKKGCSFARWCFGWNFEPNETAAALRQKPEGLTTSAHDAVRRDFPEIYLEIFEGKPPLSKSYEKKIHPRLSLHIVWDELRQKYVASVPETPGVEATGCNWETALENMIEVQKLLRCIGLLESIIGNGVRKNS